MTWCLLDHNDAILAVDKGWDEFADSNGAPELFGSDIIGQSLWTLLPDADMRELYQPIYNAIRACGRSTTISYRCDSPYSKRYMSMSIRPGEQSGTVEIEHRIEDEVPLPTPLFFQEKQVLSPKMVKRCSCCNSLQLDGQWLSIEEALSAGIHTSLDNPLQVVHVYCPKCLERLKSAAKAS